MTTVVSENAWKVRAFLALQQALADVQDGHDALSSVTLAEACLRAAYGELGEGDLAALQDDVFAPLSPCTCTPAQVARGGFHGGCPTHSV